MADPHAPAPADIPALEPCPFCKGNAHVRERYSVMSGADRFQVQCGECYCGTSDRYECRDYAIAAWNRRSLTRPVEDALCSELASIANKQAERATRAEQAGARLRAFEEAVRYAVEHRKAGYAARRHGRVVDGEALNMIEDALASAAGTEETEK
jgi:Restriction alleviation protein Lar